MENMKRLFMESRRFYLGVLLIVLLFTLVDTIYICQENDIILSRTGMEQFVQQQLEKDDGAGRLESDYATLENAMIDKGIGDTVVMSYWITIAGIILLLITKEMVYSDVRTQEFRLTWPVKKWVREIYDYLAMLGVLVTGFLTQMLCLLLGQTRHNQLLVQVLQENGIASKAQDVMTQQNSDLISVMVCYSLMMIVSYTWIYLGMSVTRNAVAGAVLSIIVHGSLCYFNFGLSVDVMSHCIVSLTSCDAYSASEISYRISAILDYWLSFNTFFWGYSNNNDILEYWSDGIWGSAFTVGNWMLGELILLFILIGGILFSARKKELSKGKLFYFPVLDYPFALVVGCGTFVFLYENLLNSIEIALILGVVSTIALFLLAHPISFEKKTQLEVK